MPSLFLSIVRFLKVCGLEKVSVLISKMFLFCPTSLFYVLFSPQRCICGEGVRLVSAQ